MSTWFCLSPLACQALSMLLLHGRRGGISPTQLTGLCAMTRPVLYVLLRRLAKLGYVASAPARLPGSNGNAVLYRITPAGRKARLAYALQLGLRRAPVKSKRKGKNGKS